MIIVTAIVAGEYEGNADWKLLVGVSLLLELGHCLQRGREWFYKCWCDFSIDIDQVLRLFLYL